MLLFRDQMRLNRHPGVRDLVRIDVVTTSYAAAYSIERWSGDIAVAQAAEAGLAVVIPYSLREGARCRGSGHCLTVIGGAMTRIWGSPD